MAGHTLDDRVGRQLLHKTSLLVTLKVKVQGLYDGAVISSCRLHVPAGASLPRLQKAAVALIDPIAAACSFENEETVLIMAKEREMTIDEMNESDATKKPRLQLTWLQASDFTEASKREYCVALTGL